MQAEILAMGRTLRVSLSESVCGHCLPVAAPAMGLRGSSLSSFLLQPLHNFCVKQHIVSKSIFLRTKIKIAVINIVIF